MHNYLTSIDLTGNPVIEVVSAHTNQLESIDVSNSLNIELLFLGSNNLSTLDVSNLQHMFWLEVWDNKLSSLEVSGNARLTNVKAWGNPLAYVTLAPVVKSGSSDFADEDKVDGPYTYEVVAPNGPIDLASLGQGTMDVSRISDFSGATVGNGTLVVSKPEKVGGVYPAQTLTYTY